MLLQNKIEKEKLTVSVSTNDPNKCKAKNSDKSTARPVKKTQSDAIFNGQAVPQICYYSYVLYRTFDQCSFKKVQKPFSTHSLYIYPTHFEKSLLFTVIQ